MPDVNQPFHSRCGIIMKNERMSMSMNCAYCDEGKLLDAFGIKICELPASKVYLFKEQSHRGRCIVASKFHVSEIVELSPDERHAFMDDVCKVATAIHKLFKPAKVNLRGIRRYRPPSAFPPGAEICRRIRVGRHFRDEPKANHPFRRRILRPSRFHQERTRPLIKSAVQ